MPITTTTTVPNVVQNPNPITSTAVSIIEGAPVAINAWPATPAITRKTGPSGPMDPSQSRGPGQTPAPTRRNGQNTQR